MIAQGVLYQHKARPSWGPGLVVGLGDGKAEVAFADGEVRTIRAPERYLEVVEGDVPEPVRVAKPRRPRLAKPRTAAASARSWTRSEDRVLADMLEAGASDSTIAEALGTRSKAAVRNRRFKLRLKRRKLISAEEEAKILALRDRGLSVRRITQELGRSWSGVSLVLERNGYDLQRFAARRWTDEDERTLAEMFEAGCDDEAIAEALDRSAEAVKARRNRWMRLVRQVRRPFAAAEVETLVRMAKAGVMPKAIADELGRSVNSVRGKRDDLRARGVL